MNTCAHIYPLSNIQKGILQSELLYPELLTNNICASLTYFENLNPEYVKKAIRYIIENNEVLRSRIVKDNNQYVQTTGAFSSGRIKIYDLTSCPSEEIKNHFTLFAQKKIRIFDACLYAFAIIKLPGKTRIYLKLHHIIADSWCLFLFEKLIKEYYSKILRNHKPDIPSQSLISYLNHEAAYLKSAEFDKDARFFNQNALQINPLFQRSGLKNIDAKRFKFYFSKKLTQSLNIFCKNVGASPYIVVLSALSVWLYKTENTNNFHILTPVRNRNNHKQKNCFGLFVNTLPFGVNINKNNTFLDHIKLLKQAYMHFLRHSKYPNTLIFEKMTPYNSLPDIFFSYENISVKDKKADVEHFFADKDTSTLSIHLSDRANEQKLLLETDCRPALFSPHLIEAMHKALMIIINQGITNPSALISEMSISSDSYEKKMAAGIHYKKTPLKYPYTLVGLFKKQLIHNPEAVAVVFNNRQLSYEELDKLSEKIAYALANTEKTNKQLTVAVCMPKSEKLIVVLMAVIKAGGIFIPLETDLPRARKQLMLDTVKPDILIEDKPNSTNYNCRHYVYNDLVKCCISEKKTIKNKGKNIAVYFTSGTTGIPNAVYLCYNGFMNLIHAWKNFYCLTPESSHVLQLANVGFDVFMADIAKSIFNGGKLILCSKEDRLNLSKLYTIIEKEKVCLFEATPALVIPLMKYLHKKSPEIKSLRHVILGGDACARDELYELVNMYGNNIQFYNSYGVTEACIETTVYNTKARDAYNCGIAPLGFALPGRRIYILNPDLQVLPAGTKGRIYIGGMGVASSYINNPHLTKERFIKSPFVENEILYYTGDYGRLLPDGNIEFLGRADQQVKLRGFRIEPAEIEHKIKELKGVDQVVVLQTFNDKIALHAFVVRKKNSTLHEKQIIKHLKKHFPAYMLPAQLSFIDKMPLTENAKIDKQQLLRYNAATVRTEKSNPKNETEKRLHDQWCKILKRRRINTNENIFFSGADSIQVMLFVAALDKIGIHIQPQDVYNYPSISELASFIDKDCADTVNSRTNDSEEIELREAQREKRTVKGILLTGATGFLGIHLLKELLDKKHTIICPARAKHGVSGAQRLKEAWNYYHHSEWPHIAEIIDYDENSSSLTEALLKHAGKFSDVIHAAALVKQWGNYSEFEQANVVLTTDIIRFCNSHKKYLHHISTTSVTALSDENNNPYIQTKHIAEKNILKALKEGLQASIYRTGNLAGRYSDGFFQKNIEENISYQIIKGIVTLSAMPLRFLKYSLDMTPVDLCSKSIAERLAMAQAGQVFTIAHKSTLDNKVLADAFKEMGFTVSIVKDEQFAEMLLASSNKSNTDNDLQIMLLKHFFDTMPHASKNETHQTALDFPGLDKRYFQKLLEECIKRDFL